MSPENWLRYLQDVKYDLLVPPYSLDNYSLTPKQARVAFEWFISKIPERIEYLRNRCAKDLGISVNELDLSPDSLKPLWKWFLETAKIEPTPKDQLAEMIEKWGFLGKESRMINYEQLSVTTQFIARDIGMYFGEVFTTNYENMITWGYHVKPKNVDVKKPLLYGFFYVENDKNEPPFSMPLDPISTAIGLAGKFFDKTQNETDLYDLFINRKGYMIDELPEGFHSTFLGRV
ncbi:MAG: hypothetical protein FWC89_08105 [Defluviitaleaceae bacterium]|nr:hypothetical protein [Defluviitaleaceae bacterium]